MVLKSTQIRDEARYVYPMVGKWVTQRDIAGRLTPKTFASGTLSFRSGNTLIIFQMLSKVLQQSATFFCIGWSGDLTVQFHHRISKCTLETRSFTKYRVTNILAKL